MLFQKDIESRCTYCQRSTPLDEEKILCTKQGVVTPDGSCCSFKYDPLKRVLPLPAAPDFSRLKDGGLTLRTKAVPTCTSGGGGFPCHLRLCMAGAR